VQVPARGEPRLRATAPIRVEDLPAAMPACDSAACVPEVLVCHGRGRWPRFPGAGELVPPLGGMSVAESVAARVGLYRTGIVTRCAP